MTRILIVGQDKGGVGKTLTARALAEAVPAAPVIEIDSTRRLLELNERAQFFPMRADRAEIERTGGRAARAEFDGVIRAISKSSAPTIVDVGANTARTLLTVLADLREDFDAVGIQFGIVIVITAEPGALSEASRLMALAKGWMEPFVLENRVRGAVDAADMKRIAAGAPVGVLEEYVMEDGAITILQAGGLASISRLDAAKLNEAHGLALGSRIRRDLTRLRAGAMEAVREPANWLVSKV